MDAYSRPGLLSQNNRHMSTSPDKPRNGVDDNRRWCNQEAIGGLDSMAMTGSRRIIPRATISAPLAAQTRRDGRHRNIIELAIHVLNGAVCCLARERHTAMVRAPLANLTLTFR